MIVRTDCENLECEDRVVPICPLCRTPLRLPIEVAVGLRRETIARKLGGIVGAVLSWAGAAVESG